MNTTPLKMMRWRYLPPLFYSLVTILILWGLLLPGYVMTLDMVFTPKVKIDPLYGLNFEALLNGLPRSEIFMELLQLFIPAWLVQKIILFLIFFIAGFSAHRLCPTESQVGRYFAGLIYMLNPFVFVRFMAGHWVTLMAFALTPIAVKFMLDLFETPGLRNVFRLSLLLALISSYSLQNFLLLLLIFSVFLLMKIRQSQNIKQLLRGFSLVALFTFLLSFYWILPAVFGRTILTKITDVDLYAFSAKPIYIGANLFLSLLSMHGFWRLPEGYTYITEMTPFWSILFLFVFLLTAMGFYRSFNDRKIGFSIKGFYILAIISLFLASGVWSPYIAPFYKFLFENLPMFRGFRDSHNFVAVLVLVYSYGGGLGAAYLIKMVDRFKFNIRYRQIIILVLTILILLTPFLYSMNMLFGFNGRLKSIDYPEDWGDANDYLNGQEGDFSILFFPWHTYMEFSWTNRIIVNPAQGYFDRPVLSAELMYFDYTESHKSVQHYIPFLLENRGEIDNFGELVAILNVKYILLTKEVDYEEYDFLDRQGDLQKVWESGTLIIYKNLHDIKPIYETDGLLTVRDFSDLLNRSREVNLLDFAITVGEAISDPADASSIEIPYVKISPIEYRLLKQPKMKYLVFLPPNHESYRWTLGNDRQLDFDLASVYAVDGEIVDTIKHTRFGELLSYYSVSLITFSGIVLFLLLEKFRFYRPDDLSYAFLYSGSFICSIRDRRRLRYLKNRFTISQLRSRIEDKGPISLLEKLLRVPQAML